MFDSGGTRKLRASTYGRGIWEFTLLAGPDFQISVPQNTMTVLAGQTAIFSGTLSAENGYNSPVNLSCEGNSPPPTCSVTPSSVTPTGAGATLSVTASGPAGDYFFSARGAGSDSNTTTHDFSLTLHVIDFDLSTPAPASVVVAQSAISEPVAFQLTGQGTFDSAVTLSCSGLPAGATCNFQPSNSVVPTPGTPIDVTVTINASSTSVPGVITVTIAASTADPSSQKTQNLSLTVVGPGDFSISNSSGEQTVVAGQTAGYGITLASAGSSTFANPVHYFCAPDTLPLLTDCSFDPNELAAGTPATTVNLRLRTTAPDPNVPDPNRTPAGSYTITVGANSGTNSHVALLALTVTPKGAVDFSIQNTSGAQSVQAGSTASYTLNFAPLGDSTLANSITYTCDSNAVQQSNCSFDRQQIRAGSGSTDVILRVSTAQNPNVTPPGDYTITVNATSGTITHSMPMHLTVQIGGSNDYVISIPTPTLQIGVNAAASFEGKLFASGGYNSAVNLLCTGAKPPSCSVSPSTLAPRASGAAFTVTASSTSIQTYAFTITGNGTDPAHTPHSTAVTLNVVFDFAVKNKNNDSMAPTIQAGQTASYNLDVRPLDGSTAFPQDVTLSCSNLPPLGSCSFTPAQVGHGSGDTNVVLRVSTTAPVLTAQTHTDGWQSLWFILPASVFASLPGMVVRRRRLALLPILLAIALLPACGGGNGSGAGAGQPGTPSGDYTITVNATCGSITRSALAQLKID
jgi:hypothetical protein